MNRISAILLAAISLLIALPALRAYALSAMEVESLVTEALTHNPEIAASEARWQMLVAKSRQAGVLGDPMLMLKIQNGMVRDPLAFDKDRTTSKVIGISQMFPFSGKRDLIRDGAVLEAKSAEWTVAERKVELRKMVLVTVARIGLVESSLRLVHENIALLDSLNRLAETSYSSGMTRQSEVLRSQIERSRMEEMRITLQQQQQSLAATLAALLHRPIATPAPEVTNEVVPVKMSATELEFLAFNSRPELFARMARLEQSQTSERLARRESYPDLTLSIEYMQKDSFSGNPGSMGEDMYSAGVIFNLPVQLQKRRAMVAEAQAQGRMTENEIEGLRHEIRRGISDSLAKLQARSDMVRLYADAMIPQAEFATATLVASFEVGKEELMTVLDSRMKLFGLRQKYYEAVAEHQIQRAELEALIGARLE